jgi:hypothetical protein
MMESNKKLAKRWSKSQWILLCVNYESSEGSYEILLSWFKNGLIPYDEIGCVGLCVWLSFVFVV